MHVAVEPDKVNIGAEFVPRFAAVLPNSLTVPAGQTVTLTSGTWDAIEVGGTLVCSRTVDTTVRFTHFLILPGGRLDCGTETSPVLRRVEFIIRDVPLDLVRDPFQWGNGILNFGTQTRVGRPLTCTWTELTSDAPAGATSIAVANTCGWQVGDDLVLPDTRQPPVDSTSGQTAALRADGTHRITAIAGNLISLTPALAFSRESVKDPNGGIVLRPRVANVTRNIVVRSENPLGTRGHTADIGHGASWDVQFNQFSGIGRTSFDVLNSTPADRSHVGTNQVGKYGAHVHHAGSSLATRSYIGNAAIGDGRSKWCFVAHVTHDTLFEWNVCTGVQGAGFVTEDGTEVRNTFRRNFAAYVIASGLGEGNEVSGTTRPGSAGSGFWFRGVRQTMEFNESWNNDVGIALFNQNHVAPATLVPSVPGGTPDTALNMGLATPVLFRGNVTAASRNTGLFYWFQNALFPVADHYSVNNGAQGLWAILGGNVRLVNPTFIASGGTRTVALDTSSSYTDALEVEGGSIRGFAYGLYDGGARLSVILRNLTLQNVSNLPAVLAPLGKAEQTNVTIVPMPGLGTPPPLPPPVPPCQRTGTFTLPALAWPNVGAKTVTTTDSNNCTPITVRRP